MNTDRLRFLFEKYVTNTISDVEREEFFKIVSSADSNRALKKMLDDLWDSLPDENVHVSLSDQIFPNILESARQNEDGKSNKFRWLRIAAVLCVLALAGTALLVYQSGTGDPSSVTENIVPQKRESFIRLADGSTVVLNLGSSLSFPQSFESNKPREVYLVGEAYFDIQHSPRQPFIVHTGKVVTTVLGTAFNIKAFPGDKEVVVTVTRGKVQVTNDQSVSAIVTRDQQITINPTSTVGNTVKTVNADKAIAWMERDIFFDDVTMEEAVAELQNRFNVPIRLRNEAIGRCRFTATFVKGEDLEQILLVICEFNNVSFTKNEQAIEIDGKGCQPN